MNTSNPSAAAPFVITVGRQFGSGGRRLARVLADRLGIEYFDKELLAESAVKAGMSIDYVERNDERFPRWVTGIFSFTMGGVALSSAAGNSPLSCDRVQSAIATIIRDIAARRSCVIVGRTADFILRDNPRCVNIFVHAPMDHRIDNIVSRSDDKDPDHARSLAEKTDRRRAAYYNFYTDKRWGDAASYDLTLDLSSVSLEAAASLVEAYIRARGLI